MQFMWCISYMTFCLTFLLRFLDVFTICDCHLSIALKSNKRPAFNMSLQLLNKISAVIGGSRNGAPLLYRTGKSIIQLPKRNASIHTNNWMVRKLKAEHVTPFGWALLVRILYF